MVRGSSFQNIQTSVVSRRPDNEKGFRAQFKRLRGQLNEMCHQTIAAHYTIDVASKESDYLYISFQNGRPVNFAICKHVNAHTLYVQVICALKGGKALMEYVIADARARRYDRIMLSALPTVINFYRKLGFNPGTKCEQDPEIVQIEKMKRIYGKKMTVYSVSTDRQFKQYLQYLVNKGLASNKDCGRNVEECNEDGYYMTLCFNNKIQK